MLTQSDFILHKGAQCPACGKTAGVETREMTDQGGAVILDVYCSECSSKWQEKYELVAFTDLEDRSIPASKSLKQLALLKAIDVYTMDANDEKKLQIYALLVEQHENFNSAHALLNHFLCEPFHNMDASSLLEEINRERDCMLEFYSNCKRVEGEDND